MTTFKPPLSATTQATPTTLPPRRAPRATQTLLTLLVLFAPLTLAPMALTACGSGDDDDTATTADDDDAVDDDDNATIDDDDDDDDDGTGDDDDDNDDDNGTGDDDDTDTGDDTGDDDDCGNKRCEFEKGETTLTCPTDCIVTPLCNTAEQDPTCAPCGDLEACISGCKNDATCAADCRASSVTTECDACYDAYFDCAQQQGCVTGSKVNPICAAEACAALYNNCFCCEQTPTAGTCDPAETCTRIAAGGAYCQPAEFDGFDGDVPGEEGARNGACRAASPRCDGNLTCLSASTTGRGMCAALCPTPPLPDCLTGEVCYNISDGAACFAEGADLYACDPADTAVGEDGKRGGRCSFSEPDDLPCTDGTVCIGLTGATFGLCTAFCEPDGAIDPEPPPAPPAGPCVAPETSDDDDDDTSGDTGGDCDGGPQPVEICTPIGGDLQVCYYNGLSFAQGAFDPDNLPGADGEKYGRCTREDFCSDTAIVCPEDLTCVGRTDSEFGVCLSVCREQDVPDIVFPPAASCSGDETCFPNDQAELQCKAICYPNDFAGFDQPDTFPGLPGKRNGECNPDVANSCTDAATVCFSDGSEINGTPVGICLGLCPADEAEGFDVPEEG